MRPFSLPSSLRRFVLTPTFRFDARPRASNLFAARRSGFVSLFLQLSILGAAPPVPAFAQTQIQTAPTPRIAVARERVFSILEALAGTRIEAPDASLLKVSNFEARLISRYRAATEDEALNSKEQQTHLAALLHHDLQLALLGLDSNDTALQKRGARTAGLSNLYVRLLPANPQLNAAIYEGFLLPGLSVAPATGWGNASNLLEGAAMAFRAARQSEREVEVLRQLLKTQSGAGANAGEDAAQADMTRIHLADALASGTFPKAAQKLAQREQQVARLSEAIALLEQVNTPDLLGAKSRLPELRLGLEQLQATPKTPAAKDAKPKAK